MTTSRPAREAGAAEVTGPEVVVVPAPTAVPDRETLARVLDGLRDLPEQPTARAARDPGPVGGPAAVPLPRRRRAERRAPSLD